MTMPQLYTSHHSKRSFEWQRRVHITYRRSHLSIIYCHTSTFYFQRQETDRQMLTFSLTRYAEFAATNKPRNIENYFQMISKQVSVMGMID